jgi:hypothetical protein
MAAGFIYERLWELICWTGRPLDLGSHDRRWCCTGRSSRGSSGNGTRKKLVGNRGKTRGVGCCEDGRRHCWLLLRICTHTGVIELSDLNDDSPVSSLMNAMDNVFFTRALPKIIYLTSLAVMNLKGHLPTPPSDAGMNIGEEERSLGARPRYPHLNAKPGIEIWERTTGGQTQRGGRNEAIMIRGHMVISPYMSSLHDAYRHRKG